MIIEPVPTTTSSRHRRAAARLALAIPVVLFAGVVAVGVLGRSTAPSPQRPAIAVPAATEPAPLVALASEAPRRTPPPPPPAEVDGLAVRVVPDVLAKRAAGGLGPSAGLIAVGGYLGVPNPPATCDPAGGAPSASDPAPSPSGLDVGFDPLGPMCARQAIVALTSWSLAGSEGFSGIGPHLHVRVPVGVRLPDGIDRTTMAASGGPFQVIVVGRFETVPPTGCRAVAVDCDTGFVLEGVAWVEGEASATNPVIGPEIDARPIIQFDPDGHPVAWVTGNQGLAEHAAFGDGGVPLLAALLRPETLARFDPDAAAAIRDAKPAGFVWYVRGIWSMAEPPGGRPLVWAVVDDRSLEVLASGFTP